MNKELFGVIMKSILFLIIFWTTILLKAIFKMAREVIVIANAIAKVVLLLLCNRWIARVVLFLAASVWFVRTKLEKKVC